MQPLEGEDYLQDLMLENNMCSERHPGLCDLGSRVGAAAFVQMGSQQHCPWVFLSECKSLSFCRGPMTYQVLILAGPAWHSCSANKQNLLNLSQPCKHPLPLQLASRPVYLEAVAIEAQCPWGHNDQLINIKLPKSWWLLLVTTMKFFFLVLLL